LALPILIDENTKKNFNLELALPILIDENTKKTHKIASFPVFCLIGHKITSYLLD